MKEFFIWSFALCLLLLAPLPTALAAEASAPPTALFVLQRLDRASATTALQAGFVDGIAVQILWREVEPAPGQFDWARVDAVIAAAKKQGKQVTLHIAPLHAPDWLFSAGAQDVRYPAPPFGPMAGREMRDVLPWDPVFLEHWSQLTREVGKRYNTEKTVMAVSLGAPSPEMVLPGALPRTEAFAQWQQRYDRATYLAAWKKVIDVYQQALPDKVKLLAPGIVLMDEFFADEVLAYARQRFGKKLWLFNAGLRKGGVPQAKIASGHIAQLLQDHVKNGGGLGLQTIWNATEDRNNRLQGSLRDALESGLDMKARYFEIYAVDVGNPALQADLVSFRKQLGQR